MRAAIVGAKGTSYYSALIFFDISLPNTYPTMPPKVFYHSNGLSLNPNLHTDGKFALAF